LDARSTARGWRPSFPSGFALTLAFALLNGGANISWDRCSNKAAQLLAGVGFAYYLLSITWVGPRFGIGNAVMFVLAGQIISSAVIDHFGLFGAPQKPIDMLRASGLVIMAAGIAIAQIAANNTKPTVSPDVRADDRSGISAIASMIAIVRRRLGARASA
jgi:transporter family-2 protein